MDSLLAQEFKNIPTMVSMVRSYLRGNYTKIPKRTILAIVSALIYFLSPIDVVPDWIPLLDNLMMPLSLQAVEFGQQG